MGDALDVVIGEEGELAPDAELPELGEEQLLELYRGMLFNRLLDERLTKLQRQGRIGFFVGSTGEEAAIIGSAFALQKKDWLVPCYREAGGAFVRGYSLSEFMAQVYGNEDDQMKGRQMPCHWASRELRLLSVSSPVGTQIPQAVGIAMASSILETRQVTLVYFGDGATSGGDFHVACNFAGVFSAPVVFLCRNNQWAISVPVKEQTAAENLAVKGRAYGIDSCRVDGNDVLAVYEATANAARRARDGKGATLIEAVTYRQGAHSTSDDPRAYRDDSEVAEWVKRDPIVRYREFLVKRKLWTASQDEALQEEIRQELQREIEEVEKRGRPPLRSVFEDVLDAVPWHLEEQYEEVRNAAEFKK